MSTTRMFDAINQPSRPDRVEIALRWFAKYSLLKYRRPDMKRKVAKAALSYLGSLPGTCNPCDIIKYARQLEALCVHELPHSADGNVRREPSLASKLLWCKYPDLVPIYDSHARRAIMVLSKLRNGLHEDNGTDYATFVRCWTVVYQDVEPLIAQLNRDRYPYHVRLFDKLLWILGKETYGPADPAPPFAVAAE